MKIVELEAQLEVCLVECGGKYLKKGERMKVSADVAPRIMSQYRGLKKVGETEGKLTQGHFGDLVGGGEANKPAKKKVAPKAKEETKSEVGETTDKSMGTQSGKPKKKTAKKKSK